MTGKITRKSMLGASCVWILIGAAVLLWSLKPRRCEQPSRPRSIARFLDHGEGFSRRPRARPSGLTARVMCWPLTRWWKTKPALRWSSVSIRGTVWHSRCSIGLEQGQQTDRLRT